MQAVQSFNNIGTFTVNNSAATNYGIGGSATLTGVAFNNFGSFIKTGAGTTTFSSGTYGKVAFSNSNTVDVQAGTLWLDGGGTQTGAFTVESGGTLEFGGTQSLNSKATITGQGNLEVSDGTFTDAAAINIGGTFLDCWRSRHRLCIGYH